MGEGSRVLPARCRVSRTSIVPPTHTPARALRVALPAASPLRKAARPQSFSNPRAMCPFLRWSSVTTYEGEQ